MLAPIFIFMGWSVDFIAYTYTRVRVPIVIAIASVFTKLPRPEDNEGAFWYSSHAATCPSVYHTRRRLHTLPLTVEGQVRKL